jgi:hypothetical protein
METQNIIDVGLLIVSGAIGWFAREVFTSVKELKEDVAKLREDLPKTYVLRDDYRSDIRDIKEMVGKIFDKLDNKADK